LPAQLVVLEIAEIDMSLARRAPFLEIDKRLHAAVLTAGRALRNRQPSLDRVRAARRLARPESGSLADDGIGMLGVDRLRGDGLVAAQAAVPAEHNRQQQQIGDQGECDGQRAKQAAAGP
jgi:hypothetical protein